MLPRVARSTGSTITWARRRSRTYMAFRFANGMFEPIWNRNFIDYVQITTAEDLGIGRERRVLRLVGGPARPRPEPRPPLLTLLCMEPPRDLRRRRGPRREGAGGPAPAWGARRRRRSSQISAGALHGPAWMAGKRGGRLPRRGGRAGRIRSTETYVALRLEVDNWRWADPGPRFPRTGEQHAQKVTEIAVTLKPVPHLAFQKAEGSVGVQPNQLILTVRPDERHHVAVAWGEDPGQPDAHPAREHGVPLRHSFLSPSPQAYERLITDAMRGDPTLLTGNDEVEAQWSPIRPDPRALGAGRPSARRVPGRLAGAVLLPALEDRVDGSRHCAKPSLRVKSVGSPRSPTAWLTSTGRLRQEQLDLGRVKELHVHRPVRSSCQISPRATATLPSAGRSGSLVGLHAHGPLALKTRSPAPASASAAILGHLRRAACRRR